MTEKRYIFRPAQQTAFPFATAAPKVTVVNGSLVGEIRRYFQPDLSQISFFSSTPSAFFDDILVVRLYADQGYIEIEDTIGPINISDFQGKEVITR